MIQKLLLIVVILKYSASETDNKEDFNEFTSNIIKYSIVRPQVIHRWTRSVIGSQPSEEKHGSDTVLYAININNKRHVLLLNKNREFLHPKFLQHYSSGASGNSNSSHSTRLVHCYYHGKVDGYEDSLVALSTCSGLRGVIILENETFGLEPVPKSSSSEHFLYNFKDVRSKPFTCGVMDESTSTTHEPFDPNQALVSLRRKKRNLVQTSYVELVVVVDNLRYTFMKKNDTAVRDEMVELANLLDGYYKQLNIRVVLVGLEMFKSNNPFSVDGTAGEVLDRFVKWRKSDLLPKTRHDMGQLIVGRSQPYGGGVLGMAFVGTVCSVATSGGINVYSDNELVTFSSVMAHEMGHNLGMNHDGSNCNCGGGSCIMSASAKGSTKFSQCSEQDFENLIIGGGGSCLRNQPSPSDVIGTAECGNGRLDQGEECDCGTPKECKNDCCDAATCRFTRGSRCAAGQCCEKCQIRVSGTRCRASVDSCDLPEYCDGKSAFCPNDFYVMDGLSCDSAYCYEGRCQTYEYQCKHLFASDKAKKAPDVCFQHANTKGDKFGNCGFANGRLIPCTTKNAMCGKVQCTDVNANNPPPGAQVSIEQIQGANCVNADFNLGTDVIDPAYVNPGSPCDVGKTCFDFQCVNASVLLPKLDCDAKTTCNSHGVCNDQGNCHCDNGWAPPKCDRSGRGGSIDSGPAEIDYSLRNGLLIFFLLVVPLLVALILVLLYLFRRDSLDVCLKRRSRSSRSGNSNSQPKNNVEIGATAQTPVPPERENPPNPPTLAPISGFRYGELDYWSSEASKPPPRPTLPERPPPPVQGPGVPKPIPPKQIS